MTSPTQLKYLDAIGIPVWISRDLVVKESLEVINDSSTVDIQSLNKQQINASQNNHHNNNSAQNILRTLDEVPIPINKAVKESVQKTQIGAEDNAPKSDSQITADKHSQQNLLSKTAEHYMYASGNKDAEWMVIGHSAEPFNGIGQEPFAGEGGILLDNMLRAVGINQPRSDTYLVNVFDIKKSSKTDENSLNILKKNLLKLITEVKPKIVLLVGQIAAQNLLNVDDPLIIMRSNVFQLNENIPCVVTYYPDYLLQKPTDKRKAWDDLKLAMSQLAE